MTDGGTASVVAYLQTLGEQHRLIDAHLERFTFAQLSRAELEAAILGEDDEPQPEEAEAVEVSTPPTDPPFPAPPRSTIHVRCCYMWRKVANRTKRISGGDRNLVISVCGREVQWAARELLDQERLQKTDMRPKPPAPETPARVNMQHAASTATGLANRDAREGRLSMAETITSKAMSKQHAAGERHG